MKRLKPLSWISSYLMHVDKQDYYPLVGDMVIKR